MPVHIIHKQKVKLQTNMSVDAFALQNRISNLLKNGMVNKLEALFNEVSPNGKIIRIDKLEIDLGTINKQNLETEFSQKLVEQLSDALSDFEIIMANKNFPK
ncbi:MAG: contractile injection system tape measure protein [Ferruginibacter sp.]